MKRIVTSIIIWGSIFLLSGCNSNVKTELEDTNNKLVEANNRIDELEEKVKELSYESSKDFIAIYKSIDLKIEEYNKNNVAAKISVENCLEDKNDYEKVIEYYKNKEEKVIMQDIDKVEKVIESNPGTNIRLFIIRTTERLRDITYHETSEECRLEGGNTAKDLVKYGFAQMGNLAKELNPGEVLIFAAPETEGTPMSYFYWKEPDGRIVHNSAVYDGKGDKYTN